MHSLATCSLVGDLSIQPNILQHGLTVPPAQGKPCVGTCRNKYNMRGISTMLTGFRERSHVPLGDEE